MLIQDVSLAILSGLWTLVVWTWWIVVPVIAYFTWKNFKKAEFVENIEHVVLSIKIPKNNEKGPVAAEMMFAALHGILQPVSQSKHGTTVQEHISMELVASVNSIEFFAWTPKHLKDFVEGQIYAQYPTAEITVVEDYSMNIDIDDDNIPDAVVGTELRLEKDEIYPIKSFQNFDVDPLAGITGMLSKLDHGSERVWIQILTKPVADDWRNKGLGHISYKKGGKTTETLPQKMVSQLVKILGIFFTAATLLSPLSDDQKKKKAEKEKKEKEKKEKEGPKLSHSEETELTAIEEKANKLGYKVIIRVLYLSKSNEKASERIQAVLGAFKQFNTTNLNGFAGTGLFTGTDFLAAYRARLFNSSGYILNIEELASLYHLPHVSVETPNIVWTSSKKGEPPSNLAVIEDVTKLDPEIAPIGNTTFRNGLRTFGIKRDDRRRHMYIIGKSGTGKSRLLESLAIRDIQNGEGVAIIDPHGELIDRVMKFIPKERIGDVVYMNPADKDFPIAFNPLESPAGMREETAKGFISVLKRMFGFSWGPRLEYVLNHTVMALTEVEGSTMLGIVRMLTDKTYRNKVVSQVTDPVVQMFWLKEFSSYNDKMATETVAPILNKVGQFTASPIIRNIVGQPKSTIDFSDIMNKGKILLVNLSTGKIGEVNSELIGSLIITKLQLAAMQRAFMPEEDRKDFHLYVDEFQNFTTDSFATILSEARKYRLSLAVANQYIAQMEETVRDAVFGNVGTLISFRVGATDAAYLEKEFDPVFTQNDIINLDNRHMYLNMLVDGVTTVPFSAVTLDSDKVTEDLTGVIVAVSREKYAAPRETVEADIRNWYNVDSVIAGTNANESEATKIVTNRPPASSLQPQVEKKPEEKGSEAKKPYPSKEVTKPKLENKPKTETPKTQTFAEKISKDDLKKIISEVTRPSEPNREVKEAPRTVVSPPAVEAKPAIQKTPEKAPVKAVEHDHSGKTIKEITPADFAKLTTIHPHEKIKINNTSTELKPGETIKFN